jgi:hypothetical protein
MMHLFAKKPALPAAPRFSVPIPFLVKLRLATLAAYGGSLIFLHDAELLAEKVYDDLCSREGIAFGKPTSAMSLVLVTVVLSVPTVLARSRALIIANLTASLITAGAAMLLMFTASKTPYECFTMAGTYEDHTSGLGEFALWGVLVWLLSFVLLVIDLSVWALRKVTTRFE